MEPIGPLMHEHRLIERMVSLMEGEQARLDQGGEPDTEFVRRAVDFISTYADALHHGKEEDILFRELKKKELSKEHAELLDELIEDHVRGRELTARLDAAARVYERDGDMSAKDIARRMGELTRFYPAHIEKEDKHFFFPVLEYFSNEERQAMLEEYEEFERSLIHDKYAKTVDQLEDRLGTSQG